MSKKIIQDIYVVKKSIRMIKKSDVGNGFYSSRKKIHGNKNSIDDLTDKISEENDNKNIIDESDNNDYIIEEKKHVTKDSLMFLWIICIISIAVLLFMLSSMFATATLTITPKNQTLVLDDTYNITSDKNISTSTLHYDVMTITKDLSKTLQTDGEEYVERKATGKATLYNNFSTGNQRLIINTRLETKDGLIYKTRESVNIPGTTMVKGVKTPGSVEVEIIADDVGDKYNMKLSDFKGDFTIFGFKGTPKYSAFYGRLNSDITGGFVGNVKKVSEEKLTAGRTELEDTLTADLIKEAYSKLPEQYILFKDNYYVQCDDLPDISEDKDYKISKECSINSIVFDKKVLSSFIASNNIKNFDNLGVDIIWKDQFSLSLQGTTNKPWNETYLKAKFSGPIQVVWSYDADEILSSIVGQDKSVLDFIIKNNQASLIEVQATIRPPWKKAFPEKEKKIKIIDTVRNNEI